MASDLKAKLAQVAARIAATQERLRGMERSAGSLREDLEKLRAAAARDADDDTPADEWGHRVPTRLMTLGADGDRSPETAASAGGSTTPQTATRGAPDDEPWPER